MRVAFLLLAALGGFGVAVYAGLWLVLPTDAHLEQAARASRPPPGRASAPAAAQRRLQDAGPLVAARCGRPRRRRAGAAVLGGSLLFWPVLLGVVGLAVLWRQADEAQRERWVGQHRPGRPGPGRRRRRRGAAWTRLAAGLGLLLAALVLFAVQTGGRRSGWPATW